MSFSYREEGVVARLRPQRSRLGLPIVSILHSSYQRKFTIHLTYNYSYLNLFRSKLTLYDECCNAVSSVSDCFETFLRVLVVHVKSQVILF